MYCSRCGTWAPDSQLACTMCGAALQNERGSLEGAPSLPLGSGVPQWSAPLLPAVVVPLVRYAGFWRRLAAGLIDGLLLFFPNAILRVLLGLPIGWWHASQFDGRTWTVLWVVIAIRWLYDALFEASPAQATLGFQLLGLRVTDVHGGRISFGRASARHFGQIVSALLCLLGYLFNLWTSRRQTLHDMIAGCVVVRPYPHAAPAPAVHAPETAR